MNSYHYCPRPVPMSPGGTPPTGFGTRQLAYLVGKVVPLFHCLDGFRSLADKPYQQALHDKAAGTVVVKVSP